jgi:nitrite reductase/ring-hydroxylating ferredoxin subunit
VSLPLCRAADLAPNRPVIVRLTPASSLIVLCAGTNVLAYRNACPHMGIELDWDPARLMSRSGRHLQCTGHGALFDPSTGRCIRGPCEGEALTALSIRIDGGMVVLDD